MKKREYLYYPYSRCLDEKHLKKALLLFDKIVFLDSQPQFIRQALLYEEHPEYAERIEQTYFFLEQNDVIRIINPKSVVDKFDLLITTNTSQDLRDRSFCNAAIKHSTEVWDMLYERLPSTFIEFFYPGSGTFAEAVSLQNVIKASSNREFLLDNSKKTFDFFYGRFDNLTENEQWDLFDQRYKYVIGGNPFITLKSYNIPFLQASSLRINEALVVCEEYGYIPFTDSSIHNQLLNIKLKNTLQLIKSNMQIRENIEFDLPYELPKEHMALKIIDEVLPDEALDNIEFAELLEYKNNNKELFDRFYAHISELSASISDNCYDENYYRNLQRVIDKKVIPEITDIKNKLRRSYEENFGKLLLQSAGVIVPTLSASIVGGLSFSSVLAACALAEMGYLTAIGADKIINIVSSLKDKHNNSYSYLLNLLDSWREKSNIL